MATVRDLIRLSAVSIGVTNPSPQDYSDGLVLAQRLIDGWNAQRLTLFARGRVTNAWTSGQSSRTIGATGNFTSQRPEWLDQASVIPAGQTTEYPLTLLTREEYARIPQKALTAEYPQALTYEPTYPNGTLTVYPVPTTAPTLVLYYPTAITSAVTLDTVLSYPPGYEEALQYQLAKRLAPLFRQPWTALLEDLARTSLARIQIANVKVEPSRVDAALLSGDRGGRWNINTGEYWRP
jgi:hypothetical protein